MKRILIATLAAAILTANASAYRVPHQDEGGNIIRLEDANCDPQAQAEMLQKLGLFMGTDNGFELDRAMTRAEAAAMLCRFLGGTAEAETGSCVGRSCGGLAVSKQADLWDFGKGIRSKPTGNGWTICDIFVTGGVWK